MIENPMKKIEILMKKNWNSHGKKLKELKLSWKIKILMKRPKFPLKYRKFSDEERFFTLKENLQTKR